MIALALQTIEFELNNVGGSVKSEALMELEKNATSMDRKKAEYIFDSDFIVYLKPLFAPIIYLDRYMN